MELEKGGLWRNWVGNQSCVPTFRAQPTDEAGVIEALREAVDRKLPLRVSGSGHSFTPVVGTGGILLSLAGMKGVQHVDAARKRVTVAAGTRIHDVGAALKQLGLSLNNQGDIDSQAIAGAFTTGTHGTGAELACMASQIAGMRIVKANGEVWEIDDLDTLRAAQVSVGTLGVISSITLQTRDAYHLHEKVWRDDFETCMERHDELARDNRHFGFFWCPTPQSGALYCLEDTSQAPLSTTKKQADICEMKVMNITDAAPMAAPFERVAYSSEIYPIEYVPNFVELEYAVPVEHGKESIRAVRDLMLNTHTNCIYPIEYRFTAGDEAWLSPFYRQPSITLSVSGGPGIDYWDYLRDVDAILRRYKSRPHWGKMHFLDSNDVAALYPRANDFRALRREMDPNGLFLNDHLRALFA